MRAIRAGALLALLAAPALGQGVAPDGTPLTGTLQAIDASSTIKLGVRENAVPFSFRNPGGEPIGFSVDLCRGVAADVAAYLHRDLLQPGAAAWENGLRIAFVTVTAEQRLPSIVSRAIDLECGSTTANAERAKTVGFSPVFFLAGTKLLAAVDAGITSYRDLAGKRLAVGSGTTNGDVMRRLAGTVSPPIALTEVPDLEDGYKLLADGKVDALASDDVLLAGLAANHPNGKRFAVVGDFLSFEPYALIEPRGDAAFDGLVRGSFARMAADDTLQRRYRRWFLDKLPTGQTLDLPMSAQLSEIYRALGQPD